MTEPTRFPDSLPEYYDHSGFIWPLYTPAGKLVLDDFPVGYRHQNGIFTAWTSTRFRGERVDFWNRQQELGFTRHAELLETIEQDSIAGFRARLVHESTAHGPVLEEELYVRLHPRTDVYVFDLKSSQRNVSADTLYLDTYHYGGLGVRGSAGWNPRDSAAFVGPSAFLTSDGLTRENGNHSRPRWTAMYGPVEDESGVDTAGLAVIPHPENFRAPQFARLHPELPYFSITPVVEDSFFIAPGAGYVARFRFVAFDGPPDAALLDAIAAASGQSLSRNR